jgi:hypothetical protein
MSVFIEPAVRPPEQHKHNWEIVAGAIGASALMLAGAACASKTPGAVPSSHVRQTTSASAAHKHAAKEPKDASSLAVIGQPVRAGVYTFIVTKFECGIKLLGQPDNGSDGNGPGGLSVPLHGGTGLSSTL